MASRSNGSQFLVKAQVQIKGNKVLKLALVMRSPCAGATLDPPLWIIPNKALSLSLSLSLSHTHTHTHDEEP